MCVTTTIECYAAVKTDDLLFTATTYFSYSPTMITNSFSNSSGQALSNAT